MKTKQQKQDELNTAADLLNKSKVLIFTDFGGVKANDINRLRKITNALGAKLFTTKKTLLNIALKKEGVEWEGLNGKTPVATVFSPLEVDKISSPVFKFFQELKLEKTKILGGYDKESKTLLTKEEVLFIGNLPPKEVLLAQLLGMLAAPIRSFLYVMDEKSKQS